MLFAITVTTIVTIKNNARGILIVARASRPCVSSLPVRSVRTGETPVPLFISWLAPCLTPQACSSRFFVQKLFRGEPPGDRLKTHQLRLKSACFVDIPVAAHPLGIERHPAPAT